MIRYTLTIDGTTINHVTSLRIVPFFRSEKTETNMQGDLLIDRYANGKKIKLSATANYVDAATMAALQSAYDSISVSVVYSDSATTTTKTMRLSAIAKSDPMYKYGDKTAGVYYSPVTIDAEEM